jgi:hypothetical protein
MTRSIGFFRGIAPKQFAPAPIGFGAYKQNACHFENILGLAQFRGENGGFVSVELSKDYHGDG